MTSEHVRHRQNSTLMQGTALPSPSHLERHIYRFHPQVTRANKTRRGGKLFFCMYTVGAIPPKAPFSLLYNAMDMQALAAEDATFKSEPLAPFLSTRDPLQYSHRSYAS